MTQRGIISWRVGIQGLPRGQGAWALCVGPSHTDGRLLACEEVIRLPLPEAASAADLFAAAQAAAPQVVHLMIEAYPDCGSPAPVASSGRRESVLRPR